MNASSIVTLLGGLGLFLLGIHHLTEGLKGLAGDSLRRALQRLVSGRFSAVACGALFTAVIQSSTAAILTVIDFLQTGMGGVSWNLEAFAGHGFGARWILAGIGVLMSIVMQSSTAAGATTLVALNAGSLTFQQGCAMIVGQSVGTAVTTGLVMIGGS